VKSGRNQPCPCGSGRKYKHCCGSVAASAPSREPPAAPAGMSFASAADRREAQEFIRRRQQGLGRPILAAKLGDRQLVTVGKTHYQSARWKTFPDFLDDYIRRVLDPTWGNAEIAKPFGERHPIVQWYDTYCRYQRTYNHTPGVLGNGLVIGVVACYLGLAYSLYLLDHNVELQARLVRRLKDVGNFQGAYYELMVANALIRAGFTLILEDETDPNSKHCEFAAISCHTGKRYWVEAKMRSFAGLLGKTRQDGGSDGKPLSRLIPHLNAALAKPAADERLIFIDLNAEPQMDDSKPAWIEQAATRLEHYEARELAAGVTAYLMVTTCLFTANSIVRSRRRFARSASGCWTSTGRDIIGWPKPTAATSGTSMPITSPRPWPPIRSCPQPSMAACRRKRLDAAGSASPLARPIFSTALAKKACRQW
jgi:hypothetical protein